MNDEIRPVDDSWGAHIDVAETKAATPEPSPSTPEPKSTAEAAPSPAPAAEKSPSAAPVKPEAPASGTGRDEKGRFAPKDAASATKPPETAPQGVSATAAPIGGAPPVITEPLLKAPQSWKPAAREAFTKAPREVQEEAIRIDGEVRRTMQESVQARQHAQSFQQVVAPYEALIRRAGAQHPLQAVQNLLGTADILHNGSMPQKIKTFGDMWRQFVGNSKEAIEMLASDLDGTASTQTVQQPQAMNPQAVEAILDRKLQAVLQQRTQTDAKREYDAFTATNPEFLEHVRGHASALLSQGIASTMQEAYDQACWANAEVRKVLQQREASKQAQTAAAATEKARAASSSVPTSPGGSSNHGPSGNTWRDHLDAVEARLKA